jgi:chlorobactene glucosyltransferase
VVELLIAALLVVGIVGFLFQGVAVVLAYRMPRIDPPVPGARVRRDLRGVSAVIAARNEAEAIGACLDDLLAQSSPLREIVVVDGGSTDGTVEISRRRRGVRVIPEPPLPDGWVGKNWACHLGAGATDGPFLLFTDADLRYHPDAVGTAMDWMERDEADLVTFGTRIEMAGFWEGVVMPFYTQMVLTYFRAPGVNRADSSAAMANGQFLIIRRSAYEAVGGHAAISGFVLEDVELARRLRSAGRRMRVGWAPALLSTRMYRDRHEMFEGLLKNVHDTQFSAPRQLGFLVGLVLFFLFPLLLLPVGLWLGSWILAAFGALLWVALFGKHAIFTRAVGGRVAYGLLFPVAVGFYLVLIATSLSRGLRHRPLEWKGRKYPIAPATRPPGVPPTP